MSKVDQQTFTGAEFEPVFFERMAEWFRGGKRGPDPRGEWEHKDCEKQDWVLRGLYGRPTTPSFTARYYRWKPAKPRTVTIDGVELVATERKAPAIKATYFFCNYRGDVLETYWDATSEDIKLLKNGNVFLTREACQAMADVQRRQRIGE